MRFLIVLMLLGILPQRGFAADANTSKIMNELGTELDLAESNLRVALNKPAHGTLPPEMRTCDAKLKAMIRLLAFEQRHPGYLEGLHGEANWDQYKGVRLLYDQLKNDEAFDLNKQQKGRASNAAPSSGGATGP